MITQTNLRSTIGQVELDELLAEREKINKHIQEGIDAQTEPWGIKVVTVEVRDVVLPENMKRAMDSQAETERARRAKVINAEGEFQAAEQLVDAAKLIESPPTDIQLRFLQPMTELALEQTSYVLMPIPMDLKDGFKSIKNLQKLGETKNEDGPKENEE